MPEPLVSFERCTVHEMPKGIACEACVESDIRRLTLDRDQWKRTANQAGIARDKEFWKSYADETCRNLEASNASLHTELQKARAERDLALREREKVWADFLRLYETNKNLTAVLQVAEEALAMAVNVVKHYDEFQYRSEIYADSHIQFVAEESLPHLEAALQTLQQGEV